MPLFYTLKGARGEVETAHGWAAPGEEMGPCLALSSSPKGRGVREEKQFPSPHAAAQRLTFAYKGEEQLCVPSFHL